MSGIKSGIKISGPKSSGIKIGGNTAVLCVGNPQV